MNLLRIIADYDAECLRRERDEWRAKYNELSTEATQTAHLLTARTLQAALAGAFTAPKPMVKEYEVWRDGDECRMKVRASSHQEAAKWAAGEVGREYQVFVDGEGAVRFVSYEPALEAVDFRPWLEAKCQWRSSINHGPDTCSNEAHYRRGIDWLICGGESGPGARPLDLAWVRSARDQCKAAGTPFFFKQKGSNCFQRDAEGRVCGVPGKLARGGSRDPRGGDIDEFPADLQVREWPEVRRG